MEIDNIYNMDCLEGMRQMEAESVDLTVICDLPYGTTACAWDSVIPFDKLWEQYRRIVKPTGAIVLFGAEPFSTTLRMSNLKEYKYDWTWEKEQGVNQYLCKVQPLRIVENIMVFYRETCTYNPQMSKGTAYITKRTLGCDCYGDKKEVKTENKGERYPVNLLRFSRDLAEGERFHPTQKPVDLLRYLVLTYTNEGDTVLDNNFFANPEWREAVDHLRKCNQPVKFHGVDVRIMDEEQAYALNSLRLKNGVHIAWDLPQIDLTDRLEAMTKYIKAYKIVCYVLVGFNSTREQDLFRLRTLKRLGIYPFVQAFRDYENQRKPSQYEKDIARWANRAWLFKAMDFLDFEPRNGFKCSEYFK